MMFETNINIQNEDDESLLPVKIGIDRISSTGKMTIYFNQKLIIP